MESHHNTEKKSRRLRLQYTDSFPEPIEANPKYQDYLNDGFAAKRSGRDKNGNIFVKFIPINHPSLESIIEAKKPKPEIEKDALEYVRKTPLSYFTWKSGQIAIHLVSASYRYSGLKASVDFFGNKDEYIREYIQKIRHQYNLLKGNYKNR